MLSVAFYFLLCWVSSCWVSLCWVSLCWVSWRRFYDCACAKFNKWKIKRFLNLKWLRFEAWKEQPLATLIFKFKICSNFLMWPFRFLSPIKIWWNIIQYFYFEIHSIHLKGYYCLWTYGSLTHYQNDTGHNDCWHNVIGRMTFGMIVFW